MVVTRSQSKSSTPTRIDKPSKIPIKIGGSRRSTMEDAKSNVAEIGWDSDKNESPETKHESNNECPSDPGYEEGSNHSGDAQSDMPDSVVVVSKAEKFAADVAKKLLGQVFHSDGNLNFDQGSRSSDLDSSEVGSEVGREPTRLVNSLCHLSNAASDIQVGFKDELVESEDEPVESKDEPVESDEPFESEDKAVEPENKSAESEDLVLALEDDVESGLDLNLDECEEGLVGEAEVHLVTNKLGETNEMFIGNQTEVVNHPNPDEAPKDEAEDNSGTDSPAEEMVPADLAVADDDRCEAISEVTRSDSASKVKTILVVSVLFGVLAVLIYLYENKFF